ncbi:N-acetylmuramoyl-L-alanine amidase [Microbulbifer sp. SSSA008]|uniref:N-acetylmuramoyl-L-alanine amidase n=1 Tax=Microbulbifer sp. SSSA008 TaxID=3243380 RepID=UPI00403949ED
MSISKAQHQKRINIIQRHSVVIRSKWGKKHPKVNNLVSDWDFDSVVIHHSGNGGETSPVGIEEKHMTKNGWDDVGYHYLIHPNGTIYEGRKIYHKGSHVSGANTKKIGLLLMGDYDEQWWDFDDSLSKSHISTANALIKTLKTSFPSIKKLGGHKEYLPNGGYTCPGNLVMNVINKMRVKHALIKP